MARYTHSYFDKLVTLIFDVILNSRSSSCELVPKSSIYRIIQVCTVGTTTIESCTDRSMSGAGG